MRTGIDIGYNLLAIISQCDGGGKVSQRNLELVSGWSAEVHDFKPFATYGICRGV
jgi:hypothetical protein